jgi:hypothetical protein
MIVRAHVNVRDVETGNRIQKETGNRQTGNRPSLRVMPGGGRDARLRVSHDCASHDYVSHGFRLMIMYS